MSGHLKNLGLKLKQIRLKRPFTTFNCGIASEILSRASLIPSTTYKHDTSNYHMSFRRSRCVAYERGLKCLMWVRSSIVCVEYGDFRCLVLNIERAGSYDIVSKYGPWTGRSRSRFPSELNRESNRPPVPRRELSFTFGGVTSRELRHAGFAARHRGTSVGRCVRDFFMAYGGVFNSLLVVASGRCFRPVFLEAFLFPS